MIIGSASGWECRRVYSGSPAGSTVVTGATISSLTVLSGIIHVKPVPAAA